MGGCITTSDIKKKEEFTLPSVKGRSVTTSDVLLNQHLANMFRQVVPIKLWQTLPAGIWKGRRVFIIGGGPSLRTFDFTKLKGEIVVTVNRGFEAFPDAVVNLAQDARLWGWYENNDLGAEAKQKFNDFKGYKAWLNVQVFPYPEDISVVDICHSSDFKFDGLVGGIPPHGNTGLNALCLAACLGASEIYLLGFDCKGENGRTANFHSGYPDSSEDVVYKSFIDEFKEVAHTIPSRTKVFNLNPDSGIKCFEFAEFDNLPKVKHPLYISYFTKGTGYEVEIERLHDSLHRFGLEHELIGIEDLGTWRKNIHARIQVLRNALDTYKRDIVYIDADGAVIHYPEELDNFDADFGAVWLDREKYFPEIWRESWNNEPPQGKWEVLGGTMYFKNNKRSRAMLEAWEKLDAPMATTLSQVHLQKAIEKVPGIKIKKLPDGYCQIFDIMAMAGEPIIEHYQASRRSIGAVKIDKGKLSIDPAVVEKK